MRQHIHSCICCDRCWNWHDELRIDDCDIRCQCIICQRIFHMCFTVSDDRKWCYFRTSPWCCRDTYELCLFWFIDLVCPFTDIQEFLFCTEERCVWVFVEHPHSLSRVHCRTASKSNYCIRLEVCHQFRSCVYGICRWVRFNLWEDFDFHIIFASCQYFTNCIAVTKLDHTWVTNDHDTFNIFHFL